MEVLMTKFILAAVIATAITVPAAAQDARTARAHYADLDLSRPRDMNILKHRVSIAINHVCGWPQSSGMDEVIANGKCRLAARRSAKAQIAAVLAARPANQVAQAEVPLP